MKQIVRTFNGQDYVLTTNNSFWVTTPLPEGLTPEYLKSLPIVGYLSKGVPIVEDEKGRKTYLGAADLRDGSLSDHSGSGTGTRTSTGPTVTYNNYQVALLVLENKDRFDEETLALYQGIKDKYESTQESLKNEAIRSLMKCGFSEEEAKEFLAKKNK